MRHICKTNATIVSRIPRANNNNNNYSAIFTGSLSASAGSGPSEQRRTWNDMHMQPFGVALSAETRQHVPSFLYLGVLCSARSVPPLRWLPRNLTVAFVLHFFFVVFSCATKNRCYENVFDRFRERRHEKMVNKSALAMQLFASYAIFQWNGWK